jgi:D-aspartate ligase
MGTNVPPPKASIPAIVFGADITALGVIRVLSRRNIKTYFISDQNDFVRHSRWAISIARGVNPLLTSDDLAGLLEPLEFEQAVLFPCSDTFLKAVVALPGRLGSRFLTSLPPPETLDILVNKGKFAIALLEAGIPHPETLIIDNADRLKSLDVRYFQNYFLKPFYSKQFRLQFRTKGFRVFSLDDALEKLERIQKAGHSVVLQEYIPGPANQHYFVDGFTDREGEIRALFVRRRERIYPPDFGNSSYCVSIPQDQALGALDSVRRLIKHLGYRGIFSAEFKFDARDNAFKILEVNARPWWYVEFASQCGVDTCWMAYRDALHMPIASIEAYAEGVGCMYGFEDFRAASKMFFKRELSPLTWIGEFLTAKRPIFSWADPVPAIVNVASRPLRFIKRRIMKRT